MDEREVHDLLRGAADSVEPPADMPDRAQRRYRRRQVRVRLVVGAVVVVLVGSGVATAAIVGGGQTTHAVVAPPTTERPTIRPTTSSTAGPSNPSAIGALSFVDAKVGFGLSGSFGELLMPDLVRTDDGGRTWRRVGFVPNGQTSLHFENADDGIAYGEGPLEVTTDGGVDWSSPPSGPFHADVVSWSGGRLWSLVPCVQSCGAKAVETSDDGGLTWETLAPPQGQSYASIVATSRSTAYIVGSDEQSGHPQLAVTGNGGSSWAYESIPCGFDTPYLAGNGSGLLLVCAQGRTASQDFDVYASNDQGRTWKAVASDPFVSGYFGSLASFGSTFIAGMRRGDMWSSSDGVSWTQGTNIGEGFWSIFPLPGVGAWAVNEDSVDQPNSGIWFSADGVHWEQRARASSLASTVSSAVDVSNIGSLTFIDANNGYGVEFDPSSESSFLVHTADGGKTWQRVGPMPSGDRYVMFAPAYASSLNDLVAWGDGSLSQSTDGGAHWRTTLGPAVYAVGEASFRLWATIVCDPRAGPSPCTPRLVTSTDGGGTWSEPDPSLNLGDGARALATPAGSSVYLASGELLVTHDYGKSWQHDPEPAACDSRPIPHLAIEADVLLLICSPSAQVGNGVRAFVSVDEGRTWQSTTPFASDDSINTAMVSATDTGFVATAESGPLRVTTDNGRSWHDAFPVGRHGAVTAIDREFGVGVWVAGSEGVWFSHNGVQWEQRSAP